MQQFDIFDLSKNNDGTELYIILQALGINALSSVIIAPVISIKKLKPIEILNPIISLSGENYFIQTESLAAVRKSLLRSAISNVEDYQYDISKALDRLFSGI